MTERTPGNDAIWIAPDFDASQEIIDSAEVEQLRASAVRWKASAEQWMTEGRRSNALLKAAEIEIERLRQALGEYGEHDAGCPKRYVQEQLCASLKTEGKCECGLDEELGLCAAEPSAAPEER